VQTSKRRGLRVGGGGYEEHKLGEVQRMESVYLVLVQEPRELDPEGEGSFTRTDRKVTLI